MGYGSPAVDRRPATYGFGINFALATSQAVILQIGGSATRTVLVRRLRFSALNASSASVLLVLNRRSSLATGGTAAAATLVKFDTSDQAATGVVNSYTADPTAGTSVGILAAARLNSSAGTGEVMERLLFDWMARPVALRGAAECITVSISGGAAASTTINVDGEIAEE